MACLLRIAAALALCLDGGVEAAAHGSQLDVRLVLEDGVTPVAGCRLALLENEKPRGAPWRALVATSTASDGTAVFRGVVPRRYAVAAGLCGEALGIVEFVTVEPDRPAHLLFRVRGVTDVVGSVRGAPGTFAGVTVRLADAETKPDAEGRFAFRGVCFGHRPATLTCSTTIWLSGSNGDTMEVRFVPGVTDVGVRPLAVAPQTIFPTNWPQPSRAKKPRPHRPRVR